MKPREAADNLRCLVDFVSALDAVPNYIKTWFCPPVRAYLDGSDKLLDQLLFLRSRNGGRITRRCTIPERDDALRFYAEGLNLVTIKERALEIERRSKAGDLKHIEKYGRIPGVERLQQILSK